MSTSRADRVAEQGLAERFALVRRIVDEVAHELKNPLNAMVINLELLRTRVRTGRTEDALDRIEALDQETRRLHTLLDHTLRLLRPDHDGPDGYPVDVLLAEVGSLGAVLAKLARRGFELRPTGDDVIVAGPRDALRFALLGLVEAAVAGLADESDVVVLAASAAPAGVRLELSAPAVAAERLRAALPSAARLLAEEGIPLAASLDESGCRVDIALARAAG